MKMRAANTAVLAMVLCGVLAGEARAVPMPDGAGGDTTPAVNTGTVTVTITNAPPTIASTDNGPRADITLGGRDLNARSRSDGLQPRFKSSLLAVFKAYVAKQNAATLSGGAVVSAASALLAVCPGAVLQPASVEAKGQVCLIEGLY